MQDLRQVYFNVQQKKREKNEIAKMIRDELAHSGEYQKIVDELKRLRERKASIENQVKAGALSNLEYMDALKDEISAGNELMADIALTMYANGETVEIVDDERGVRLSPVFSVKFQKDDLEHPAEKARAERAESHPERTHGAA
jgi:predicted nuclease with TOPRIM domain